MRIETLRERIDNAKAKIEKKQNTIVKKTALIEKKEAKLPKLTDENEIFWMNCDIKHLHEDIERLGGEIEETKASLAKYEAQMAGELEKEAVLLKEVPESMKRMQTELVTRWDEYDIARRESIKEDRRTMEYKEFCKKYRGFNVIDLMYRTDEQIHKSNEQDAKMMILGLYYRVKDITGEVTDWSGIACEVGNMGAVLTGFVIGKEGRAEVETILAGGYNIQRLHVRTLVHAR